MVMRSALLGTACALALAGSAQARGWYAGIDLGLSAVSDTDVHWVTTSAGLIGIDTGVVARFESGFVVLAAVGYALQQWRIEGELGWRSNDKDQFTPLGPSSGDLDELTVMFNMTYDIPLGNGLNLALGAGAGVDYAMLDIVNVDDGSFNFAYQGIAALYYAVAPNVELALGYRYLHVLDPEFKDTTAGITTYYDFEDISKHAVTLGVRYTFAP